MNKDLLDYLNIIVSVGMKISHRYNVHCDVDDLRSDVYLWYCEAQLTYDSGKGATFKTYFDRVARSRFKRKFLTEGRDATRNKSSVPIVDEEGNSLDLPSSAKSQFEALASKQIFLDRVEKLGRNARRVVEALLYPTKDLVREITALDVLRQKEISLGLKPSFPDRSIISAICVVLGFKDSQRIAIIKNICTVYHDIIQTS